jgi:ribosomal protein S18 acetylase RimI-like enzyme
MEISVRFYEDAAPVLASAGEFLRSRPVLHNLILTLLDARLLYPEPARFWVAFRDGQVAGVVFQSPLTRPALLVPMNLDVIEALVEAIADQKIALPGVNGDAATAASFAGRWTERCKAPALPALGMRLYELGDIKVVLPMVGTLRKAGPTDRDLAIQWVQEFNIEINEPEGDFERATDTWIASGQLWFWEDGNAVSMAVCRKPIEGVVRVSGVYTAPEHRRRGYAEACVYEISKRLTEAGYRSILYTDLSNPTSNSIYRRIGYKAVAEALLYRFG